MYIVCKIFAILSFDFCGAAPMAYVQAGILNLLHPYLRVLPYFLICINLVT